MEIEQKLLDYLMSNHTGRDNAIHSKALEKRFKICPRTVRRYINNMRKTGIPVCSDETGYWIAQMRSVTRITDKDIQITVKVG